MGVVPTLGHVETKQTVFDLSYLHETTLVVGRPHLLVGWSGIEPELRAYEAPILTIELPALCFLFSSQHCVQYE